MREQPDKAIENPSGRQHDTNQGKAESCGSLEKRHVLYREQEVYKTWGSKQNTQDEVEKLLIFQFSLHSWVFDTIYRWHR